MNQQKYTILNSIYQNLLNRDITDNEYKQDSMIMNRTNGIRIITNNIIRSNEYINKNKFIPKSIIKNGFNVTYRDLSQLKDKKILLLSLIKDCANNIYQLYFLIKQLNNISNIYFYYFSNNNTDKTINGLEFLSNKFNYFNGTIYQNEILRALKSNTIGNRINKLAEYRNLLFRNAIEHYGISFDYIIVMDMDFLTAPSAYNIGNALVANLPQWSCISGNYCYKNSQYYYDSLALRELHDKLPIEDNYSNFHRYYGKNQQWIDKIYIFENYYEVQTAFGGLSIYNGKELLELYNKDNKIYTEFTENTNMCEHITLCKKLQYKQFIDSNIYFQSQGSYPYDVKL